MSEKIIRSEKEKKELIEYINAHPDQRIWQCIRNWSGNAFILRARGFKLEDNPDEEWNDIEDTFYFEGKDK